MKRKALLSWSSGKDSAWALHTLRQDSQIDVVGLLTVVNEANDRVAMHATRSHLLRRQSDALGLRLQVIHIPDPCSNEEYGAAMRSFVDNARQDGIECMAFGDLFLEDIRDYREQQLKGTGLKPAFPIWNTPTDSLAKEMWASGVEAYISCLDPRKIPKALAGRRWSEALLGELPEDVDPCGENGEFHTVVVDGPMFRESMPVRIGQTVERQGFVFTDIIPVDGRV